MRLFVKERYLFGIIGWLLPAAPVLAQQPNMTIPSAHAPASHVAMSSTPNAITPAVPESTARLPQSADIQFPALQSDKDSKQDESVGGSATPLITVASSLTIVLGLFAGLVWLTRRFGGSAARVGAVPGDVLQSLGSTAIDARTRVIMLRCGSRIVVAAQTTGGIQPLCEISDPQEVHELTVACTGQDHSSLAESMKTVARQQPTQQPTQQPAQQTATAQPRGRGRLFATA